MHVNKCISKQNKTKIKNDLAKCSKCWIGYTSKKSFQRSAVSSTTINWAGEICKAIRTVSVLRKTQGYCNMRLWVNVLAILIDLSNFTIRITWVCPNSPIIHISWKHVLVGCEDSPTSDWKWRCHVLPRTILFVSCWSWNEITVSHWLVSSELSETRVYSFNWTYN